MRLLIAALLFALPGRADAQPSGAGAFSSQTPTLPAIGLPLPPIGLPLPAIGLPPGDVTPTLTPAVPPRRGTPRGAGDGQRRGRGRAPVVYYVVPGYGWSAATTASTPGAPTAAASEEPADPAPGRRPTGTLQFDLEPRVAGQVFVDGAYAGTLDDLRHELTLDAGRHDLEIRHPGYEPLRLAVRIDDGRAITYRGTLQSEAAMPEVAPPPPSIERKPLYYIPGCYLGDVPPKDAGLPASCDQTRALTFRP